MSGGFNRTRYDVSYFPEFIDQETGPGAYEVNKVAGERQDKCVSNFGPRTNSIRGNGEIPSADLLERKEIENYLIEGLNIKYGKKCVNARNDDNTMTQTGGAGVDEDELKLRDEFKFYIFYELK
jgi:hypothetical protein